MILMHLTSQMFQKSLSLHLISSHPLLWESFYFTPNHQSSRNVDRNFFRRNIGSFFRAAFFYFSGFEISLLKYKNTFFRKNIKVF